MDSGAERGASAARRVKGGGAFGRFPVWTCEHAQPVNMCTPKIEDKLHSKTPITRIT